MRSAGKSRLETISNECEKYNYEQNNNQTTLKNDRKRLPYGRRRKCRLRNRRKSIDNEIK